ncbi:MAG: acyl-CoA dehydrogenase family protein [Sandaracinus sp.]
MDEPRALRASRSLRERILARRDDTESQRRIAPSIVDALADAGLFRIALPRAHGGLEATPRDALDAYEELADAEASVAWVVWNNALPAIVSRHLAPAVRREVFSDPRLVTANSTRPTGVAAPCEGGLRVRGRWSLVSGCELAQTLFLRCVVVGADGSRSSPPELVIAIVPRERCTIVDTWHVGGLRGTGSHDVIVENAVVPLERTISLGPPSGEAPIDRMPFAATLSAGCAAIALGIARGARTALVELVRTKMPTDGTPPPREQPAVLARLARLDADRSAARLLLHAAADDAFRACVEGRATTMEERASVWKAAIHAASVARDVVRASYELAGTAALYTDSPIERAHRDVHAVAQHVILSELWLAEAGRVELGAAPTTPMFVA